MQIYSVYVDFILKIFFLIFKFLFIYFIFNVYFLRLFTVYKMTIEP